MVDLNALAAGFNLLFSDFTPWLIVIPGILIGLTFGAIPGLQISMAMAIFLPMTLYMDFMQAMLFLTAIFTGGSFGGSIPAILMNIPGTSSAISTTFDGYPMARQGKHNMALGIALGASCVGVIIGYTILLLLIGVISEVVLKIGPAEMSVLILWGITLIASLSGNNPVKGIIAGFVGLLLGTVGFSEAGNTRGTLGLDSLLDGVPVIPAMMGMFAAAELFRLVNTSYLVEDDRARKVNVAEILAGFRSTFRFPGVIGRGSMIGVLVGSIPGVGSSIANLLSYVETKRRSKHPESFGTGNPAGVVASESANSTSEAGSLATLLALGIPGGGATAVMLAAFTMHNITGGPVFIREQADVVYAIILANFGQAFLLIGLGLVFIPVLANVVKVPMRYLIPSVLALSIFGAYGLTGTLAGPITLMIFSLLGWLFKRYDYSIPACVIGLLLGGMADEMMIYTHQISGGQWSYLFQRPIAMAFLLLLVISLFGGRLIALLRSLAGRQNGVTRQNSDRQE